jgi:hypothetical protein
MDSRGGPQASIALIYSAQEGEDRKHGWTTYLFGRVLWKPIEAERQVAELSLGHRDRGFRMLQLLLMGFEGPACAD